MLGKFSGELFRRLLRDSGKLSGHANRSRFRGRLRLWLLTSGAGLELSGHGGGGTDHLMRRAGPVLLRTPAQTGGFYFRFYSEPPPRIVIVDSHLP